MNWCAPARSPQLFAAAAFCVTSIGLVNTAAGQGSLTPPAGPAPTMKSLDQIASTGVAINSTNTAGATTEIYLISKPGSYYLTGNVTAVTGKIAINVQASNVTIELNGFALVGIPGSKSGIFIGGVSNVCVKNGSLSNWGEHGIDGEFASSCVLHDIASGNNGFDGIQAGVGFLIRDCLTQNNGGAGIRASDGALIQHCASNKNKFGGIRGADASSVIDCVATANTNAGIVVGTSSVVKDCTASNNNSGGAGSAVGISTFKQSAVLGCNASGNSGDGIQITGDCLVMNNDASVNVGNGITVEGTGDFALNRIDGNMANHNGAHGIVWDNDFVVRNVCLGNGPVGSSNYSPAVGGGSNTGPLQLAGSATSPWANF